MHDYMRFINFLLLSIIISNNSTTTSTCRLTLPYLNTCFSSSFYQLLVHLLHLVNLGYISVIIIIIIIL